LIKSK